MRGRVVVPDTAPYGEVMAAGPTIYDVARAAGVAPSTVSRAFSRPGRVRAETAERIREVARELGYRAAPLTHADSAAHTSMVALAISDVTNPFNFPIIKGAHAAAAAAGFTMLLADAQESGQLERQALERTLSAVEGVVLASSRMSDSTIRLVAKQKPLIVLNRTLADVPSVITDNPRGIERAVRHLAGLGHRGVTYVAGPEASWADGIRWLSLRNVCAALGLRARRIGPFAPTVVGGTEAAARLAGRRDCTAVVAYNDLLAIGVLRGVVAAGLRVPQDVSIVGCDDIFAADLVTPGLTTVAAPLRALGETAVHNVIAMAGGARSRATAPVVLPTRLVVRSSTGPSPR